MLHNSADRVQGLKTIKNQSIMTELEFIKKWKLSMPLLATKLGISTGGFNNKLRGNKAYFFTKSEKSNLKSVLKELAKDIKEVK